jgi:endo-1,4-beta-xylanase
MVLNRFNPIAARLLITALWVTCAGAAVAPASPNAVLPPNAVLIDSGPARLRLVGQAVKLAAGKIVSVTGMPFDKAWHVEVKSQPPSEYQIELASPIDSKVQPESTVLLTLWAKAIDSADADHHGTLGVVLEQNADPYDKLVSRRFDLTAEWQRFDVAAKVGNQFNHAGAQLAIRLGYLVQTLEIGGVTLREFDSSVPLDAIPQTPMTYRGRQPDAPWRQAAQQRIDSMRKSRLTVRVTDPAGSPVNGATVQVRMLRTAFAFGCVYNDRFFPDDPNGVTDDDQAYQQHFVDLFNTGVDEAAMKWPGWENPAERQAALRALQWMRDHNIAVRGHNLVWPGWRHLPSDLRKLAADPAALEHRIDDHIRDVTATLASKVVDWDVINEPYVNNDLMHILGDGAMSTWFKLAAQGDPAAHLYLNETNVPTSSPRDHRYDVLYDQLKTLQQEGAPIFGVGMQAHFDDNLVPPADLLKIYDRFATLGIPIRITELDINVEDEQLQADYLRDFLTASFSDPEINGILLWGFWQSAHWRPDAALYRKDWNIKPNGQVWKDLVLGKWQTNTDATSGIDGTFATRAFLGDYSITVTAQGHTVSQKISLPKEGYTADFKLDQAR